MSKVFSALLLADIAEEYATSPFGDPHRGILFDDIVPSVIMRVQLPDVLADPQIIVANNESGALESAIFLAEEHFPKEAGWTNHNVEVADISKEMENYLKNMLPGHPFEFYLIGGIGLVREKSINSIKQRCVAGASMGANEEQAYHRFKETLEEFPKKLHWIGGQIRVTLVPEERLWEWRSGWMYDHLLQNLQLKGLLAH